MPLLGGAHGILHSQRCENLKFNLRINQSINQGNSMSAALTDDLATAPFRLHGFRYIIIIENMIA
jgi:hypothetical protein